MILVLLIALLFSAIVVATALLADTAEKFFEAESIRKGYDHHD